MAYSLLDVARETMNDLPMDGEFETILPYHQWHVSDEIFSAANGKRMPSGLNNEFPISYRAGTSTTWTTPGAVRNPQFTEHFVNGTLAPVLTYFQVTHLEAEIRRQYGAAQGARAKSAAIVDVVKGRRQAEKIGFLKAQEDAFFDPPVVTGDAKTPHGLPYHQPPITGAQVTAGTGTGAFQGANGIISTGTAASWCGIDRSAAQYAGLRTYNACWDGASAAAVTMSETNLTRLGDMFRRLHFQAPMNVEDLKTPAFSKLRVYTDEFIVKAIILAARNQNDSLGNDVLKFQGTGLNAQSRNGVAIANGLPVRWVERLDTANTDARGAHPLYLENLDYIKLLYSPSCFMLKRPPATDAVHTPDVIVEYVDSEFTYAVTNPQSAGGVISWVAAA